MTRQRLWAIKKQKAGLCKSCAKPRGDTGTNQHCRSCADKWNAYQRLGTLEERKWL